MTVRQLRNVSRATGSESAEIAQGISRAIQNALVARELGALARHQLPYPFDEDAEWTVLAFLAGSSHELRRTATPDLFFFDLHRACLQAILESSPNDPDELARQLARRIHGGTEHVEDLALRLTDACFTWGLVSRSVDRLMELRERRELIDELEALARGLRVESHDAEHVRRRLRRIFE